ncbi:hypothetical protein [Streptomyces longispororuber]|uniref:hypothetical protein n=1 Tax=Streptomyces longispororuber TaxID=68230 RepID=UPI00210C887A|nr:hypothetical protein [Streptomyces longispororuber]MCQ4209702.1 hypothetical protein [Streptomyces longispororuber]
MSMDTWAGVRERVRGFARHPGADRVFGARGHGFRLGPVLGEEQLLSLDAALQTEIDVLDADEPRADDFADDDAYRQASAAWNARYEELYDAQEAGAVFLGEQGCGYTSLLVTTGPHRGEIWEDLRPMDRGIVPTGLDFAQWYRRWLARTEQELATARARPWPGPGLRARFTATRCAAPEGPSGSGWRRRAWPSGSAGGGRECAG